MKRVKSNSFHRLISALLVFVMILSSTNAFALDQSPVQSPNVDTDGESRFVLSSSNVQSGDEYYPETANREAEIAAEKGTSETPMLRGTTVGDPMVYLTQKWLNQNYGDVPGFGTVTENGKTGWNVIYGLTRALQHELGITDLADNFGPTTSRLYGQSPLHRQDGVTDRKFAILQGALWCKGYNPGYYLTEDSNGVVHFLEIFNASVENAVIELKQDAGLVNPDGIVTTNVMKALLSMDAFKLLGSYYGGRSEVRSIQQQLNRSYEAYTGLNPCDGVYGRNTNRALIYAIQAEEGLSVSDSSGTFGPTTRRLIPQIPYTAGAGAATNYQGSHYSSSDITAFIKLLQYALLIHGFGDSNFSGVYSSATKKAVRDFQRHYALPVTGTVNLDTWMALFVSSGNPSRSAIAADCAMILNEAKAQTLYNNGYRYIGRYLTGTYGGGISKALTVEEANIILDAGLRFFPIYQTSAYYEAYFTEAQGTYDGLAAITAARALGLPNGTTIYFAVDFDAMDYQITDSVLPYFEKVYAEVKTSGYKVGVYGARNVCSRVSKAGYACSSFVGDMSTGFSGNLGFTIPDNWAFSQFANLEGNNALGTGDGRIEIDKDAFSGRDQGVGKLNKVVKKAIYVLPGYMGSRLYTSDGDEYWADQDKLSDDIFDYVLFEELSKNKDILRLDANGENPKVHVDATKDFYGTSFETGGEGIYKNLIDQLEDECDGYDVVFFPYNWLGDLNDAERELEKSINDNEYSKVVFVTHSTGGLLAASYIAKNRANKLRVEKAVLIAPPLYGTYDALNPLETGKVEMITDEISNYLSGEWYESIAKPFAYSLTYKFIRKAVKNSPTTYQLLPSGEYLKLIPQLYNNQMQNGKAVTNINEYYDVLNGSANINPNLTNGNSHSHQAFRNSIGDIVSVLQSVDTTIVGTSKGHETFAIAKYEVGIFGNTKLINIVKTKDGDDTVLGMSAFALDANKKHSLKYKDFAGDGNYSHMDLAMSYRPIKYVCDTINGTASASMPEKSRMLTTNLDYGMSDKIKIVYDCNSFVDVNIFDSDNNNVAQISENNYFGFDRSDELFDFTPLDFSEEHARGVIYLPNTGYKITFSSGYDPGTSINFSSNISTLDEYGWDKISVTDSKSQTSINGILASYDGTTNAITDANVSSVVSGTVTTHFTDWSLPDSIELNIEQSSNIILSGTDASQVTSLLSWDSTDESVATVSSNGQINAIGYGKTAVVATDGNKTESCEIIVTQNAISVSFIDLSLRIGEKYVLNPTFSPVTTTQTNITYTYDTSGIINIDENGVVTALSDGTVTITGTTDNGISSTFTVTVFDSDFERKIGDANGDECVDIRDLVRAKKHLAGIIILTGPSLNAINIDNNNDVNASDLILLRQILLGILSF